MAYTASGTVRDLHTRTVIGGATVYAFRKDTGAAHTTASVAANSTTGVFSFTDLVDGVEYDFFADAKAGPHVVVAVEGRRSVQQAAFAVITAASVASNGATGRLGQFGPVPYTNGIRVKNVFWSPTGADNATHGTATSSATYRRITLVNGGTSGTATPVIATLNLTASAASLSSGYSAASVDTTVTVASGGVLYANQVTVGGTDNDATVLAAGQMAILYEIL